MKNVVREIELVDRECLERIAYIVGNWSAASDALRASKNYHRPLFFRDVKTQSIIVVNDAKDIAETILVHWRDSLKD